MASLSSAWLTWIITAGILSDRLNACAMYELLDAFADWGQGDKYSVLLALHWGVRKT